MNNVSPKYYYIVYLKDWLHPKLLPVYYLSKAAAKRAVVRVPKRKRAFYEIVRGSKLREFGYRYVFKLGTLTREIKWDIPKHLDTPQKRKSYRTLMRRRLRRMGIFTKTRGIVSLKSKRPQGRLIKNRQIVANSPNTLAMAFRLERKPKNFYYIIHQKHISDKKGILFDIIGLKVDIKKKTLQDIVIKVKTTDVLIPYLITEVFTLYGKQDIIDRCRAKGIRLGSARIATFLKANSKDLPAA